MLDLLVFSWFPQKAEQNREKWRTRINNSYKGWKGGVETLFQKEQVTTPEILGGPASETEESATADGVEQQATT